MSTPRVSFIISAYDRPQALRLCLQSLELQTEQDWEAIVMDNAVFVAMQREHDRTCREYCVDYHRSEGDQLIDCYYSSEWAAFNWAHGEWLCFPSDDGYMVPEFAAKLVDAGERERLDWVCCDFVWGRTWEGRRSYTWCDGGPQTCHVDKTSFMVRRAAFEKLGGWPGKDPRGVAVGCDGMLAEAAVAAGMRCGRVCETLVVHN